MDPGRLTARVRPAGERRTVMAKGAIVGRVLGPDGAPWADAVVLIATARPQHADIAALTGPDGRYRFEDLAPGQYRLLINAEGALPATVLLEVTAGAACHPETRLESETSN